MKFIDGRKRTRTHISDLEESWFNNYRLIYKVVYQLKLLKTILSPEDVVAVTVASFWRPSSNW